jgi:hypothetical protein
MAVMLSATQRQKIRSVVSAAQREAWRQHSSSSGNVASAQQRQWWQQRSSSKAAMGSAVAAR